jgi:hypothetical protein
MASVERVTHSRLDTTSSALPANIRRDIATITAMVGIYCYDKHATGGELCATCAELLAYAHQRLAKCPYGAEKTTCRECPIHCYRVTERAAMRDVMRYAGPRMLRRHPFLAIRHLWIERHGAPKRPARS